MIGSVASGIPDNEVGAAVVLEDILFYDSETEMEKEV